MDSEAQLQACKGLANHDVLRLPMGINEPGHLSILTKKKITDALFNFFFNQH